MAAEPAIKKQVTLTDGTVVEFTEKQKMQLEVATLEDGDFTYKAIFADGTVRNGTILGVLTEKLALHGLGQKLRDSISGEKTIADAIGAFEDVAEVLEKGEWSIARTAGDGPKASKTELAQAIAAVRGIEVAVAANWLASKTPAEKIKMRSVPAIALKIAELRAAAAAAKPAAGDDVFAGLGA